MPAGDLVVSDYQLEMRLTLTGEGTAYRLGPQGIGGLGDTVKANDTPLAHAAGSYLGRDFEDTRTLTIDYLIVGTSPAAAMTSYVALRTMWAPSQATTLPLHFRLPGMGKQVVYGRPRGLVEDLTGQKFGLLRALATFVCGDPTIAAA